MPELSPSAESVQEVSLGIHSQSRGGKLGGGVTKEVAVDPLGHC